MIYIQTQEGTRYELEQWEHVWHFHNQNHFGSGSWYWQEGMTEWQQLDAISPPTPHHVERPEEQPKDAALHVAKTGLKLLGKAASGMGKFASLSYKKATLKSRFSVALAKALEDGHLDDAEISALQQMVEEAGANWNDVIQECKPIATKFVRHLLADAVADGDVTKKEELLIAKQISRFDLHEIQQEVRAIIGRTRLIARLDRNELPIPLNSQEPWLKSGETLYQKSSILFFNKKNQQPIQGTLWITNTRVEVHSAQKTHHWKLDHLRDASGDSHWIYLLTNKGEFVGQISGADYVAALILALMRCANRLATPTTQQMETRVRKTISQDVRNAVWIRDGGLCQQCGADDYLEFDHIIPFSRGGSDSVANIQLLCRRCNAAKGNRI